MITESLKLIKGLTPSQYWQQWHEKHKASVNERKRIRYRENLASQRKRARVYYHKHRNEVNEKDCEQRFRWSDRKILDDSISEAGLTIVSSDWLQSGIYIVKDFNGKRTVETLRDPLPVW